MKMKKTIDKEIKLYIKEIKRLLLHRDKGINRMLGELEASITEYAYSHPDVTISDIRNHFGEAETIAEGFGKELDEKDIKRYRAIRVLKIVTISILSAILLFAAGLAVYIAVDNYKLRNPQAEIEIVDHGEVGVEDVVTED